MSIKLKNLYAAAPNTARGLPTVLSADPTNEKFVYGSGNVVYIRSLKNPLECETYTEHAHNVTVAKYAPSGYYIASGDVGGNVRIWATNNEDKTLKVELRPVTSGVRDLAWDSESKRLVAVGDGKDVFGAAFIWDTGSPIGTISGHSKAINSCDYRKDRPFRVVTGGEDFNVNFYQGPPFKFQDSRNDHTRFVNCVRFSPDGNRFVSVASDSKGFLYDGKTGAKIGELAAENGHTGSIYSVSWSPDSRSFITASADKTVKLWDVEANKVVSTFTFADKSVEYMQVGTLWAGNHLLSVSLNGDINYLDVNNPSQPLRVLEAHNKLITGMAYSHKTNRLFTGSYEGTVVGWDIGVGSFSKMRGKVHTNSVNAVALTSQELVTVSNDDTIKFTPLSTLEHTGRSAPLTGAPCGVAVSRNDDKLAVVVSTNRIAVLRDGQIVSELEPKFSPLCVALSADDQEVAIGSTDKGLRIFTLNGNNLTEKTKVEGHRGQVTAVTYSNDGKFLASGDSNREIIVWETAGYKQAITNMVFHNTKITCLSWSVDSRYLVSGSLDCCIFVWDLESNCSKKVSVRNAHPQGVTGVAFVNENTIVSVGNDCCVKTWIFSF